MWHIAIYIDQRPNEVVQCLHLSKVIMKKSVQVLPNLLECLRNNKG